MYDKGWKIVETENMFSLLNKLSVTFQTFSSDYSTELFRIAVREGILKAAKDLSLHIASDVWDEVFWDAASNLDVDMVTFLLTSEHTNPHVVENYKERLALFTASKNVSVEEEEKRKAILDQLMDHKRTREIEKEFTELSLAPQASSVRPMLKDMPTSTYATEPLLDLYNMMGKEEEARAVEEPAVKEKSKRKIKLKQ